MQIVVYASFLTTEMRRIEMSLVMDKDTTEDEQLRQVERRWNADPGHFGRVKPGTISIYASGEYVVAVLDEFVNEKQRKVGQIVRRNFVSYQRRWI